RKGRNQKVAHARWQKAIAGKRPSLTDIAAQMVSREREVSIPRCGDQIVVLALEKDLHLTKQNDDDSIEIHPRLELRLRGRVFANHSLLIRTHEAVKNQRDK